MLTGALNEKTLFAEFDAKYFGLHFGLCMYVKDRTWKRARERQDTSEGQGDPETWRIRLSNTKWGKKPDGLHRNVMGKCQEPESVTMHQTPVSPYRHRLV